MTEFINWSGSLSFSPSETLHPKSEEDLQRIVSRAGREGRTVRPVGRGHSSSQIIETEEILVSMDKFRGLVNHDLEKNLATVGAGSSL